MSEELREAALRRLKSRTARIQRLLDLEAPDVILVNEAHLLADAARMLSPEYWAQCDARAAVSEYKRQLQLCCHDGCGRSVAWVPSAETPTCPGPFHGQSCLEHAAEDEAETADADEERAHDREELS